jgi:hypothetical protein
MNLNHDESVRPWSLSFLAAMPSDHTLPYKVAERILVNAQAR